ncbi:hypothetical protein GCM10028857_14420 [Salinarchaeum chitinilyticum]
MSVAAPAATTESEPPEPPQAVAGLDQTVERNASVLLDATQSFSPDGELVAYDWHITTPTGGNVDPTCDSSDCGLAHFRASELGEYAVTVTVTDDAGQEASDTLYVTVVPEGDFGVELTGPPGASGGDEVNLTTTISPGASVVENVTWYRGEQEIANRSVPELGGVSNQSALIVPGATYRAVVADQWNQTVSDTWSAPGSPGSWTPDTPSGDEYPRIEGPAVVTGAPDAKTSDGWEYQGVSYTVQSSERGEVTDSVWVVDNGEMDDFSTKDTLADLTLLPGVNVVTANLDLELEQLGTFAEKNGENTTAVFRTNTTLETETVLNQHVVVDPAPEFDYVVFNQFDDSLTVRYRISDPYNPASSVEIFVGGDIVVDRAISDIDGYNNEYINVADDYGKTSVTIQVEDGRGQTAVRTKSITLPPPPSDSPSPSADTSPGSRASTMPAEQSASAGTSPPSSKLD